MASLSYTPNTLRDRGSISLDISIMTIALCFINCWLMFPNFISVHV